MKKNHPQLLLFILLLYSGSLWSQNPVVCTTAQTPGASACADACLHCFLNGRIGQTSGITANPAPGFCGAVENNQWFAFVAGADSIAISVMPSNCQTGDGIEIALYRNCSDAPIACAAGQPGDGNTTRTVTANLTPGETYFLMVDGYDGDQCSFQIVTAPAGAVAAPPIGAAGPIHGPVAVFAQTTLRYAVDAVPEATAYRWEGSGSVQINGQIPPVTLPAPAGSQVSVTFTEQSGTLCVTPLHACAEGTQSCIEFSISAGNPLVAPCPSNDFPGADFCEDACVICSFTAYTGGTWGYTGQTPQGFCGAAQSEQWIGFVAGKDQATFTFTPSNCSNGNGLQVALYPGNCNADPIACNAGQLGGGNLPLSVTATLNPGTAYFLLLDGFAGDDCEFAISVSPPDAAIAPSLSPTLPIEGPPTTCPGAVVNYSVPAVPGTGTYIWSAPPGWRINGRTPPIELDGPGGNVVQVQVGNNSGQLCVQPINSCYAGTEVCKNIIVQPIPTTNLPPVSICAEDAPYYTPWGEECPVPGTYCFTYTSYLGCDSVVCQQVNIRAPIYFIHAPRVLCSGESMVVCGESFSTVGNFSKVCESYQGCDSTVLINIVAVLEPLAQIEPIANPACAQAPLILNAAPSPGTKTWKRLNGNVIGSGNSVTITEPGSYILVATAMAGGKTCEASDTITIQFGGTPPQVAVQDGIITCAQPMVQLDANANPAGLSFAWSGPSGFFSSEEDPVVDQPGTYQLIVTDPITGCSAQATALVTADVHVPVVAIPTNATINCTNPDLVLPCPPFLQGSCSWSGPGIIVPGPNPIVDSPGVFLLTVTGANGCTTTAEMTVVADFQIPIITVSADTINCYNQATTITCEVDIPMSECICVENPVGFCYMVVATAPNGCTNTATVQIYQDINAPSVSVADDTLRCDQPGVVLQAETVTPNAIFAWSGPGGFISMEQNPVVNEAGVYSVAVTNPGNGCSTVATATVYMDSQMPLVLVTTSAKLNCANPSIVLQATANMPGLTYFWSGPGGFSSNLPNPEVTLPGIYTLEVVNPANGCTSTVTITVQQDVAIPQIAVLQVMHDTFGQGVGSVSVAISHSGAYTVEWFFNGQFISNLENINGLTAGDYTVIVTGSNGCTNELVVSVEDTGVSAPEILKDNQWGLYPNPTSGQLYLRYLGSDQPEVQVFLLDATGRTVLEHYGRAMPDVMLACNCLPPGMYSVLIRTREAVVRRLVVVQR
jgi:hypothetical protein